MTAAEWPAWTAQLDLGYVEQMVEMGGMSPDAAQAKADADRRVLLTDGQRAAGHLFLVAESGGRRVATLWLGLRDDGGDDGDGDLVWVYDIEVDADVRGQGYGRAVMELAESEARALGHDRLGLHVFARNVVAIALYTSMGYRTIRTHETGHHMIKVL